MGMGESAYHFGISPYINGVVSIIHGVCLGVCVNVNEVQVLCRCYD